MNKKQRVKAALSREALDKVPFGEFAVDFDTVEKLLGHETYLRAKAKSQIAFWEGRRDEVVQSWKEDTIELFKKLDCFDLINLSAAASGVCPPKNYAPKDPPVKIGENTWKDKAGRVYQYSPVTADITVVDDPTVWDAEYTVDDFVIEQVAKPDDSVFEVVDYVTERLGDEYFIIGSSGGESGFTLLGSFERGLTEFLTAPEVVAAATAKETAQANQADHFYIQPRVDAVMWGVDFAYNAGPFIDPALFRQICLPNIQSRVKNVKERFSKYVFKHACGNNWKLMDMFIEAGYDCYQSLQGSASMDLKELKRLYGSRICLWGGLPVEHLVSGTREEIKADVAYIARYGFENGGYIFGSSHSIAVGTKYDNFMSMIDEFEKVRAL